MKTPILLGATGRVASLVIACWPKEAPRPLLVARRGGAGIGLVWDRDTPPPALPAGLRPGAVIDLAGVTPRSGADLAGNTALGLSALAAARDWGAPGVLIASTAAVYGATGSTPVSERAPATGSSAYGRAKLEMERAVAEAASGFSACCLRIGNAAGAGEPFDSLARQESPLLDRFADGLGPSRSFIGPASLARVLSGLATLLAGGAALPPLLNVAAPKPTAMAAIFKAAGRARHWRPAPPGAVQRVHLDTAALQKLAPLPADAGDPDRLLAEIATARGRLARAAGA